ncbi:peptidylprolyl isomerase [Porphyrobacter sp. HT-58-2]|uniref:peptidylprolyl isomerase n=1 Tax=Porphyrobacter sp. HT-58-2 TaxID=2023229 RepID=UPI000CDCBF23|nr:peptidylprolyl isomerase [Porphyrobacter sp. HT-58-2]AUX69990.1 peptidylprolyl isomerase [Porphyrobacter sp. HT-58-2]
MISFFRRFFESKIGLPIVLAFLGLMALAFAASDITGSTFGGVANTDRMAVVGDATIPVSDLSVAANTALDQVRERNPTITMPEFVTEGGLDEVIRQLIDRYAVGQYGSRYGLRAGENLVNSEILQIPVFQGLTGGFDEQAYLAALRQRGLTDTTFRRDLADGLIDAQLLRPAIAAPQLPEKVARQYASLVLEKRKGEIALIPSAAFAPAGDPTEAQLTAWYKDNRTQFIRPERRTLRFAVFGEDTLKVDATPTAAEIAARFKRDATKFAASERRAVTSFVVPTEDAAKALVARIRSGASLEAAAREAGFTASTSDLRDREAMSGATSFAFAQNAFKAAQGGIVDPAQGTLGWYVARVDRIERTPARTLEQATPEITAALTTEKRAAAIGDLTAEIEAEIDGGTALAEVAKAYGLKIETTPALLADGRAFGRPEVQIVPQLAAVLQTAFQMEESEPQLAQVSAQDFVVFEVARIEEASAPPLAQVRAGAIDGWKRSEGAKLAKAAANRIAAKVRAGTPLAAAMAAENKPGFEREVIDLERRQLLASRAGNVPPPLVLMFSMAKGTVKPLEGPRNLGWYVVSLDDISTLPLESEKELVTQTRQQLAQSLTEEYRAQVTAGMRKELGVTRNDAAITAVRKQLAGEQ